MALELETPETQPSYVREVLLHRYAWMGLLVSLLAAGIMAIPYRASVAGLPLLGYLVILVLCALVLPSLPTFRKRVDLRHRQLRREAMRKQVKRELVHRTATYDPNWTAYNSMVQRVQDLRRLVKARTIRMSEFDVERVDDASVEFLRLWQARFSMAERLQRLRSADLASKLSQLEAAIASAPHDERAPLERERHEIVQLQASLKRLEARDSAAAMAMHTAADVVGELYENMMSDPAPGEASKMVQKAVAQLRIEDDLEASFSYGPDAKLAMRASLQANRSSIS